MTLRNFFICISILPALLLFSCEEKKDEFEKLRQIFVLHPEFVADGFDFPVGKPDANGYYNANKFKENNHLGEDWNGVKGGNSDLGDPIYSIAKGYISFSKNVEGGWGNVIRIIHKIHPLEDIYIESLYAHCDTMLVKEGDFVNKGQMIGTIGNCNGKYYAHLHFELRDKVQAPLGGGYSTNYKGFLNPTEFIENNRSFDY